MSTWATMNGSRVRASLETSELKQYTPVSLVRRFDDVRGSVHQLDCDIMGSGFWPFNFRPKTGCVHYHFMSFYVCAKITNCSFLCRVCDSFYFKMKTSQR